MYAVKTNMKLQETFVKEALSKLAKKKQEIQVDHSMLLPLKVEVRNEYFMKRHDIILKLKRNEIKKSDMGTEFEKLKENTVKTVCNEIDLCIKALSYCADKGLMPLKGNREKFAMDIQNPYLLLLPKFNIKVDAMANDTKGKEIVEKVAQAKGAKNYWADMLPESPIGETPNMTSIKKAFNMFVLLRKDNLQYKSIDDFLKNCRSGEADNMKEAKRKISLLAYLGYNDQFFEYLGSIRDVEIK